ncbi:Alpha-methylacyl-CoA racemase [Araneus ventricosus]|uniref:Alpha-methylacyl-CoA racemase n=1 Tax=Araneus ventricosus TaxID=182803 RepID=A0A4Y2EVK4_ARAVE|nr:Alpha-methylacyl-CoA racemase [Araneus ventricosus]
MNFNSALLTELCKLLGILKTRMTSLHPESDGIIERFNRTILNHLALFVSRNQPDWDTHLPLFLLAYRSTELEVIGLTPAEMLFGRTLRLPCDILFGQSSETPSSPNEYIHQKNALSPHLTHDVEGSAYVSSWLWSSRSKSYPFPLWSRPRGENILDGGAHFYQTYETKDGKFIAVGALEPPFYDAFIKGLGLDPDDLTQNAFGSEAQKKCAEVFLTKTQAEWCDVFDLTDACVTPVVPLEEAHNHPHNSHNQSFMKQDETMVPIPAPRLSRTSATPGLINPIPGQHTREILLETGFSKDEIESFIEDGTVYCTTVKPSL